MKHCPTCHTPLLLSFATSLSNECLQIWRCPRCAFTETGKPISDQLHIEPEYTLSIVWRAGELPVAKIKILRQLDPVLAQMSIVEVVDKLKSLQRWNILGLRREDLARMQRICEDAQLKYQIT